MKEEVGRIFGVPADKVRVIPNGISESWLDLSRKEDARPLVIFVGRLVPEKGPQVLVDAMADVVREFPTAELVLAAMVPWRVRYDGGYTGRVRQGGGAGRQVGRWGFGAPL
jgi:1,4-alpha-glucan branching enzyme